MKEVIYAQFKTIPEPIIAPACQQTIRAEVDANRTTEWSQDFITRKTHSDEASARVQQPITTSMDAMNHEQQRI